MTDDGAIVYDVELAPEPPPKGPRIWLRDNLFSTPASVVLSILSIALVLVSYRGLLSFVFDDSRRWDAVTYNMKLLMVEVYPQEDLWRMWVTVGIVAVLLAGTLAVWRLGSMAEPRRVGAVTMATGGAIALGGVLALLGEVDAVAGVLGVANMSVNAGIWWIAVGAVLMGIGWALRTFTGERAKEPIVPVLGIVGLLILIGLAVIWTVDVPVPAKIIDGEVVTDGAEAAGVRAEQVIVYEPIAESTTFPWTLIALAAIAAYWLFKVASKPEGSPGLKRAITTLWVLAFPVLVLVFLRKPVPEWDSLADTYVPGFLVAAVVGGFVLWWISRPQVGEVGRVVAAFLLVLAFASFLIPMPFVFRLLALALAVFALSAPSFGGEGSRGLLFTWIGTVAVIAFFSFVINTESGVDVAKAFFLGGLALTIIIAFTAIVLSFPLGIILALGRTSTMPIFRLLCTAYIELVRGVPLITWLLVAFLMLPVTLPEGIEISNVLRAIGAMTFFSAAYLAENVRGGLQSIPSGQKEAARALGMSTIQMTVFITLPQALRAVIPAIVGQVIALFKDTSLVTIVGLFDLLHIARLVIPTQSQPFSFIGSNKETLIFAALVYWCFTFTFSRISLRLEKRLGVGER